MVPRPYTVSKKSNNKNRENNYNDENKIQKIHISKKDANFPSSYIEFNNEIIKYHLMKNKIYILCLSSDGKLSIYNILKCEKIFEIPIQEDFNTNFQKMVDIINQYDNTTLKSWFTIDIKLGIITITFNKNNVFNNMFNFDPDYLEKIIEKTENFKNLINAKHFTFSNAQNETSNKPNSTNVSLKNNSSCGNFDNKTTISTKNSLNNDNPSGSFNKKETGMSNSLKIHNLGQSFIKSLFDTFVKDVLFEIKDYLQKTFYDRKGLLNENFYENLKNNSCCGSDIKININDDIYIFSSEDEYIKSFSHFKEFKNFIKNIDFIRDHTPIENVIKR